MPKDANCVAETSTTVGTGQMTLGGAVIGYQSFLEAYGNVTNTEVPYGIRHDTLDEWEVGIGTFLTNGKLQRDFVRSGSNGASRVAFSTGNKIVYVTVSAEGPREVVAFRPTDIPLILRGAAGQTASLLQTWDNDGDIGLDIDSVGKLRLTHNTTEMMRMPTDEDGSAFIGVQRTLVGSPGTTGIRFRFSGDGTTGVIQWSQGDSSYVQLRASLSEFRAIQGTGSGGGAGSGVGLNFFQGIKIKGTEAELNGVGTGQLGFDCEGTTGGTNWDIGPANNDGTGTHNVRLGRRSAAGTSVRFQVVTPGSTVAKVTLSSGGVVTAERFDGLNYFIGGTPAGADDPTLISSSTTNAFNLRSGITGDGAFFFRDLAGTLEARIDAAGTSSPTVTTVITREKGDARYQAISSQRFKERIRDRTDLARLFGKLTPKSFVWGGELPNSDERRGRPGLGFILEELLGPLPEACRYVRGDDGKLVPHGLDPLALIAVLWAKASEQDSKIAELEQRLAALEARPTAPKPVKPRRT